MQMIYNDFFNVQAQFLFLFLSCNYSVDECTVFRVYLFAFISRVLTLKYSGNITISLV